jgi:hypothetical protein
VPVGGFAKRLVQSRCTTELPALFKLHSCAGIYLLVSFGAIIIRSIGRWVQSYFPPQRRQFYFHLSLSTPPTLRAVVVLAFTADPMADVGPMQPWLYLVPLLWSHRGQSLYGRPWFVVPVTAGIRDTGAV